MKFRAPLSLPLFRHPRANFKDQVKLILGAVVYPAQTRRWRSFLSQNPAAALLAQRYPRVLHKIYRPYLSRHLDCNDRVNVMMRHYQHITRFGLDAFIVRAAAAPVSLATFEGKRDTRFELRLSAANHGHREGELTLQLCFGGAIVYAASFTLSTSGGSASIQLGALQGIRAADGADTIKRVTKALHGYRPSHWMVALVRDLGDYFGCRTMRMASNRNRVTINWRRGRRITSDYDAMWRELKACQRGDGDFEFQCIGADGTVPPDVPSHKRAEARRRAELLALVCGRIRECLDSRRVAAVAANHVYPRSSLSSRLVHGMAASA